MTEVKIHPKWQSFLQTEFDKIYFKKLIQFVKNEYAEHQVYPPGSKIFAAFDAVAPQDIRVVILGQDPYHGKGQANGLSFSVNPGVRQPPSLQNIFKEIQDDVGTLPPEDGDLTRWATQGVFLLNATLTVREKSPGSHQNQGWEQFTDAVIKKIAQTQNHIVFMLWGNFAQSKADLIDENRHYILKSSHPSPFSAHRGFFGAHHFSKANYYLVQKGLKPIEW